MRIREVLAKGIGPFVDMATDLPADKPIVLVFAENGIGKSSFIRAIELGLGGSVLALDGSGLPLHRLRRVGAPKGGVQILVERPAPLTIKRVVGEKGITTSVEGQRATNDISDLLGVEHAAPLFRVLCNATGFFAFKAADQKALLTRLVPQEVPVALLNGLPIGNRLTPPTTLDALDAAYDLAYAKRRALKAERDAIKAPDAAALGRAPGNVAAIEAKLSALERERDDLIRTIGTTTAQAATLAEEKAEARRRLDEIDEYFLASSLSENTMLAQVDEAEAALKAVESAAEVWDRTAASVRDRREQIARLATARERLAGLDGACVIGGDVRCPMKPSEKGKAESVLAERIARLQAEADTLQHGLGDRPDVEAARERCREARETLETARRLAAERVDVLAALTAAKDKLAALPDVTATEQQIAALDARIAEGRRLRDEAQAALRERNAALRAKEILEHHDAEIAAWEALVQAFGPKGIKEKLLVERLGAVVKRINGILSAFGLSMTLTEDPWEIQVNWVPTALLAESEVFRAGIAFQVALAEVTGVKLVLVDGADILDGPNRRALWATLMRGASEGWVEQAIVTATYAQPSALTAKFPASFAVYRLLGDPVKGTTATRLDVPVPAETAA